MRPIVHSNKHYKQMSLFTVLTGTTTNVLLAHSVAVSAKDSVDEVEEGALVKAVYIELWGESSSNNGSDIIVLSKNNANAVGPTFAEMAALGNYVDKKNILFTHQGLTSNDGISRPAMMMRSWYKIPKGKQRFGLGDKLNLSIANPSANTNTYCGFALYKEYS